MDRENRNLIYICTRIFNYSDKLKAECFEEELKDIVNCNVFMPFRDSNENQLEGPNRTKIVYDSDIERLNSPNLILLAVIYDGICKDEGVSFEIGYAYGKGIPIFIVNTDFIWYEINGLELKFDPIISYMCSDYLQYYKINEKMDFKNALYLGQKHAFNLASKKIKNIIEKSENREFFSTLEINTKVFIDFGGGRYEYQREYALWLKSQLELNNISAKISNRYNWNKNILTINQIGQNDINCMLSAEYYVCLGDEVELNSGTGALLGLARCVGKKIIMYESSDIEILGEKDHRMKKNLMIDFAVDKVAKSKNQLINIILEDINV